MARWTSESWRKFSIRQVPRYDDEQLLLATEHELKKKPPLVFSGECDRLTKELAACVDGDAFLLQGGDCAESFLEFNADIIRDTYKVLLQMAVVLTYAASKPVVKIGRIAGQFAKPRSENFEEREGKKLPSYRGDMINAMDFTHAARSADPNRMIEAYNQSAAILNLLRAFSDGGFADLHKIHQWTLDFVNDSGKLSKFHETAEKIQECLSFMEACGLTGTTAQITKTNFYTSHESLLLWYEQALTRQDSISGDWYDCSAHFLWLGDRTRFLDSAHVEFLRGVKNPIGIKCGPDTDLWELIKIINLLNPDNIKGRISLIVRMGHNNIIERFPPILNGITEQGLNVVWSCDPMHGNTEKVNNFKTRRIDNIFSELQTFFEIHESEGSKPGGIHVEMTGKDVTECLGGSLEIKPCDLESRYHTHCDPRLNDAQALELAFMVADLFSSFSG